MLKFEASKKEVETMIKIVDRFEGPTGRLIPLNRMNLLMDLEVVHCNGNPLRLTDLLEAKEGDFNHDISGIMHHLDRETGKLQDCFLPRYSA